MAEKRIISMTLIAHFFKENMNHMAKGENSYSSMNVVRVLFDPDVKPALLKGEVRARMKNRCYSVEISLDPDDGIIAASCTCPRGQVICHHMAAVCIFGFHNFSVTDQACTWNAPRKQGGEQDKIPSILDMYPCKPYRAVKQLPTLAEIQAFIDSLEELIGFKWLWKPEPSDECVNLLLSIEDILFSQEYLEADDKAVYFESKTRVSQDTILRVAVLTKGQHRNENWLVCRKHRLTASHFGVVLSACSRNKYPPSLFKTLLGGYDLENVKAIQWGRENEKEALKIFQNELKLVVEPTGLWLDEGGYLGASPDGLIGDDAIIEIKCPYKYRQSNLELVLATSQNYIIYKNADGNTEVNEDHPYWHQIQGQLFITKRNICYLVVWTPNTMEIVLIERRPEWSRNLDILRRFYIDQYLEHIIN